MLTPDYPIYAEVADLGGSESSSSCARGYSHCVKGLGDKVSGKMRKVVDRGDLYQRPNSKDCWGK